MIKIGNKKMGQEIVVSIGGEHDACQQSICRVGFIQDADNILRLNVGDTLIYYLSIM